MAEDRGTAPGAQPPEDRRPRPQYGELAPEGWSWQPPQDRNETGPEAAQPAPARPNASAAAAPGKAGKAAGLPGWDRPVTLSLLVLGLFGTMFSIAVLGTVPQAVQMLYTQQGLGTYRPDASVAQVITAGSIALALVWLATAGVSILLLVRGRRAFYVPIIGAVVAGVVIFAFMTIILGSDPTLLDFYSRP